MGEEINVDMKLRESFLDFKDDDIDLIIRFLNKPNHLNQVLKYGDIDYPSRLAKKLIRFSPWKNALLKIASKMTENVNLGNGSDYL